MKCKGNVESINLSTGEKRTRYVGNGESILLTEEEALALKKKSKDKTKTKKK